MHLNFILTCLRITEMCIYVRHSVSLPKAPKREVLSQIGNPDVTYKTQLMHSEMMLLMLSGQGMYSSLLCPFQESLTTGQTFGLHLSKCNSKKFFS